MRKLTGKRYWLVGASEGLGRALAEELSRQGVDLVLSARSAERLQELADTLANDAQVVPVDIADSSSVRAAAEQAGDIDGVVFLAGVYWPFKATEWDPEKVEKMCDVNFTGAARVVGSVLPQMVARDRGHIVLTGSLSGFRGLPGASGYAPSKAGVMAMAESMYADLKGTGVAVQIANPGFIKTRLTEKNDFNMPFIMEPEDAAKEMIWLMRSERFKHSFPRVFASFFRIGQFLPDWLYYRVFA